MVSNAMTKTENIVVLNDEPMSRHTSWRAGGVAKRYVQAKSVTELAAYISTLPEDEELLWLGLGSNTLVRDGGFKGTVIATQGVMTQMSLLDDSDEKKAMVYVGAGVASAKLARFCSKQNLAGAEFFAGIPGLVGGALAMNAGAFGGETWPLVKSVETMNHRGEIKQRDVSEFEYGYRHVDGCDNEWFVSATLQFDRKLSKPVDGQRVENNTIDIKNLLARRAASQPTGVASCGSVFRNPEGGFAAQLIESCGLKGYRIGGAVVSDKHANFIINDNKASANDIEKLIAFVQKTVEEKHNVLLQTEVKIVGDESDEEGK